MCCTQEPDRPDQPAAEGGLFAWKGFLLAMSAAPVFGLLLAWAGHVAQAYFAPMILFPVLLGVFSGATVVGLVRLAQIGNRRTIVLAAVLTAAVAAVGEHYFSYQAAYHWSRASADASLPAGQDLSALARAMAPSFGEYMQAQARRGRPLWQNYMAYGWAAWLSWVIDAILIAASAVAVTIPAMRVPYCNRCGTWYRTARGGRIDAPTARRLAELADVEGINHPRSPRYRLSTCLGGCGPTRLELSWEEADGAVNLVRLWLDPAGRNQVVAVLDALRRQ